MTIGEEDALLLWHRLREAGGKPHEILATFLRSGIGPLYRINALRRAERLSLKEAKAFKETVEPRLVGRHTDAQYERNKQSEIESKLRLVHLFPASTVLAESAERLISVVGTGQNP